MTREQNYTAQMKRLGIYDEAFDPEISTLAQLERELSRMKKAWKKTAKPGQAPSVTEPIFTEIRKTRAEILQHRETLGLTPKSLRKLNREAFDNIGEQDEAKTNVLQMIRGRHAG